MNATADQWKAMGEKFSAVSNQLPVLGVAKVDGHWELKGGNLISRCAYLILAREAAQLHGFHSDDLLLCFEYWCELLVSDRGFL